MAKTGANIELLGVHYTLDGDVIVNKDEIEFKNIPVKDEDGNLAFLNGKVLHTNFDKFSYNFKLDFESPANQQEARLNSIAANAKRFLVLNTKYKEGESYYGKAYGKGYANISGKGAKMDVDVFLETKSGSQLNFPMYGV